MAAPDDSEVSKAPTDAQCRYDLFENAKPYYGSPILGADGARVPTLFVLCTHTVMAKGVPFAKVETLPPLLKSKLEYYRRYEVYKGPKVMKCSVCGKFYTTKEKFQAHSCEPLTQKE